jgi:8-oxo-dGTP pyrophosphatase MutT (NUDIX family)
MMPITVVYALEPLPPCLSSTIFLAGPTPRDAHTPSWRPRALELLEQIGYQGTVMVPEDRSGQWRHSYDDQVDWEARMRAAADIILFWVPRDMGMDDGATAARMPALTTNVEFGLDLPTGKVLYGRPEGSHKNRYLDHLWKRATGEEPETDLEALLRTAAWLLGSGHERHGTDAYTPLNVYLHQGMSAWKAAKEAAGHKLLDIRPILLHPVPPAGSTPWLCAAQVVLDVAGEDRIKANELVISRPDASAVAAFHDGPAGLRVVMVHEFRAAATTADGCVLELPGGSSPRGGDPRRAALEELEEEAGLSLTDTSRLLHVATRQAQATLLIHSVHLYALLLSDAEAATVEASVRDARVHGVGSGERITLRFPLVSDIDGLDVDWGTLGMVRQALTAIEKT